MRGIVQSGPDSAQQPFGVMPLSDAIGAEIVGLDLREAIPQPVFEDIRETWHAHGVLLFRDQVLDELAQAGFGARFGELGKVLNNHNGRSYLPGVMYISNIREDGKLIGALPDGEMFFHSDQCYVERPGMATMLYAMEVPSYGGNTLFANMYTAYDTLPERIRIRIEGKLALNVYDYDRAATTRGSEPRDGVPSYAHPVVRTHPATGRRALYVNRLMTHHIVGMDRSESDEILEKIFDHQERPEFIYEHVWRPGDLMIWDNRCTLHARSDFSAGERRMMRRVAILGDKPY